MRKAQTPLTPAAIPSSITTQLSSHGIYSHTNGRQRVDVTAEQPRQYLDARDVDAAAVGQPRRERHRSVTTVDEIGKDKFGRRCHGREGVRPAPPMDGSCAAMGCDAASSPRHSVGFIQFFTRLRLHRLHHSHTTPHLTTALSGRQRCRAVVIPDGVEPPRGILPTDVVPRPQQRVRQRRDAADNALHVRPKHRRRVGGGVTTHH